VLVYNVEDVTDVSLLYKYLNGRCIEIHFNPILGQIWTNPAIGFIFFL